MPACVQLIFSPQMKLLILLLLCLSLQAQAPRDYAQLLSLWQKAFSKEATFSLKQFASQQETCGDAPCQPFYFISENAQLINQPQSNLTVLLLGGLRGDDLISSSILLNAYGHINAARTIFFPLANPSGINKKSPLTFPGSIDPEKDFPVSYNQKCFQSAAAKSLLYLYQTYSIDLTIYVHDGKPSITYSWGTKQQDTSQSQDFGIYADIADMVRFEGNGDKQMDTIEAGTVYELQPAVTVANFVDWAYGAQKYPEILSRCGDKIEGVASAKFNGLVLALGVGKIATGQGSISKSEKQLSRALLLLQKITSITAPRVQVGINSNDITVTLYGCKTGTTSVIKLTKETGEALFQRSGDAILKGDISNGPAEAKTFSHRLNYIPTTLNYQVTFQCDNGWVTVGKTAFSKSRIFTQKGSISTELTISPQAKLSSQGQTQEKAQEKTEVKTQGKKQGNAQGKKQGKTQVNTQVKTQSEESGWRIYEIIGGILVLFGVVWMIVGIRLGMKVQHKQRIKNFNQKFQTVEVVEDIEAYSTSIDEKETVEEGGETKEHDHDIQRLNEA